MSVFETNPFLQIKKGKYLKLFSKILFKKNTKIKKKHRRWFFLFLILT